MLYLHMKMGNMAECIQEYSYTTKFRGGHYRIPAVTTRRRIWRLPCK